MRTKRSKDTRLVDKFSKRREDLAAESHLHRPVNPTTADADSDNDDFTHSTGNEEDTLKVRNCNKTVQHLRASLDNLFLGCKCNSSFFHQGVFSAVVGGKRRGPREDEGERPKNKKSKQTGKDEEYYIPYRPKDFNSEKG